MKPNKSKRQLFVLLAWNTESPEDIRFREYTTSIKRAEAFRKIPKIQFTDSGHGIVFSAFEVDRKNYPTISVLSEYVREHMK